MATSYIYYRPRYAKAPEGIISAEQVDAVLRDETVALYKLLPARSEMHLPPGCDIAPEASYVSEGWRTYIQRGRDNVCVQAEPDAKGVRLTDLWTGRSTLDVSASTRKAVRARERVSLYRPSDRETTVSVLYAWYETLLHDERSARDRILDATTSVQSELDRSRHIAQAPREKQAWARINTLGSLQTQGLAYELSLLRYRATCEELEKVRDVIQTLTVAEMCAGDAAWWAATCKEAAACGW